MDGSRDKLAKFMALVMCALLDMLILACEMLDAGTIADMRAVAGQPANRMSLDVLRSCVGLARVSTTASTRVRQVVDIRAKPDHDGIETPATDAIAQDYTTPRGHGPFWAVAAFLLEAPSKNAAFQTEPTHGLLVA